MVFKHICRLRLQRSAQCDASLRPQGHGILTVNSRETCPYPSLALKALGTIGGAYNFCQPG
jgi:hypothetical protein